MNTDVMFSSATGEWETPQDLFDFLDGLFHFTLDAAASVENAKCARYFTKEDDALVQTWSGRVWVNPPYGREIGGFVEKGARSVFSRDAEVVVMLLPARTDTAWWHDWVMSAQEIWLIRGRLKFGGAKNCAPFPSCVVVFTRVGREKNPDLYQLERDDEGVWGVW